MKEPERKMGIMTAGPECFQEQQHNKPLEIKDQAMFDKMLEHVHMNPVMAGFVINPENWKYSSARDFYNTESRLEKGLIE